MQRPTLMRVSALVAAIGLSAAALVMARDRASDNALPAHVTCTSESAGSPTYRDATSPSPTVSLRKLADVADPTDTAIRPGDPGIYVSSRIGQVFRIEESSEPELVLDVGALDVGGQGGLMSLTFDPDGTHLYVNYTLQGVNHVMAHAVNANGEIDSLGIEILSVDQPTDIHNFGTIVFGPDGNLYIASGDGGDNAGLPDIRFDGQNIATIFGGILRIQPEPDSGGYSVPPDNPFTTTDRAAPELWAFGLRNPWRFSFDSETDDLWIGDVGQYCWEEVSHVSFADAPGTNFGWSGYEGFHKAVDQPPDEHLLPIHEYRRGEVEGQPTHCAVIGGFVYNGQEIPELGGTYVYADWCARQLETLTLHPDDSVEFQVLVSTEGMVQAMGEDSAGELLILTGAAIYLLEPSG